jgi:hypothetical protein
MRTYYVRPRTDAGYGTSYENAWNGLDAVDWSTMNAGEPAQLWVCGDPRGQPGFMTVFVEWSYIASAQASPDPRRESAQPV